MTTNKTHLTFSGSLGNGMVAGGVGGGGGDGKVIQGIAYSNKKRSCLKHILYVDKFYHFFK
jgi:hypothetical protein